MKNLLNSARHEILDLRRRNEMLSAQMAVVEVFATALGLGRHVQEMTMTVDVAWELQNKIEELERAEK